MRKSFSNATSEGLGVIELKNDKKAVLEIKSLCDAIFENQPMSILNQPIMKTPVENLLF